MCNQPGSKAPLWGAKMSCSFRAGTGEWVPTRNSGNFQLKNLRKSC